MIRKTVSVTLPEEVDRFFREAAARQRTSKSALIRRTLAGHIARNRQELPTGRKQRRVRGEGEGQDESYDGQEERDDA